MKTFDDRRSNALRYQNLDLTFDLRGVNWSVGKSALLLQEHTLASVNYNLSFSRVDRRHDPQIYCADGCGNQGNKQNDQILSPYNSNSEGGHVRQVRLFGNRDGHV